MNKINKINSTMPPSLLILGGGAVVTECYIPALLRLGWQDRAVIVDKSDTAGNAIRRRCPSILVRTEEYDRVLKDPNFLSRFDGVVIALPNSVHEHAVLLALQAGLHVLCEKPLGTNGDVCTRLAAAADQARRKLAVAMVRRFIPSVGAIRDVIKHSMIGEVQDIDINHGGSFSWPSESGSYFRKENGGLFLNMGIHYLDMIESWVGPLSPLEYWDDQAGGVEANCRILLHAVNGANVRLRLSYTHELANRIYVRGTQGEISADVNEFGSANWRSFESGLSGALQATKPLSVRGLPADFISAFVEQFIRFGNVVAHRSEPDVSAAEAVATQRIVDWAYSHRKPLCAKVVERSTPARPTLEHGRTIVTGGSGFLGVSLIERLSELGFADIIVPVRSHQSGANVARFPVNRLLTDLLDRNSVRKAVVGARYVFHLAYGASGSRAARVTVEGTKNVVDAAVEAGAEAVVVVSTATVFGHPRGDQPINEHFPYRPVLGEYGRSKAEAEKYALRIARAGQRTRIAIVNPAGIYGPNGRLFVELPARMAMAGQFTWIEEGRGKFNYAFVENVVDALLLAANQPAANGENFIVSDGVCTFREFYSRLLGSLIESVPSYLRSELLQHERNSRSSWRDLARGMMNDEVLRALNEIPVLSKPKKMVEKSFPNIYARLQVGRKAIRESRSIETWEASTNPVPPAWLADIFGPINIEYCSAKARRVLGWNPHVPLETGIAASRNWLHEMGIPSERFDTPAERGRGVKQSV